MSPPCHLMEGLPPPPLSSPYLMTDFKTQMTPTPMVYKMTSFLKPKAYTYIIIVKICTFGTVNDWKIYTDIFFTYLIHKLHHLKGSPPSPLVINPSSSWSTPPPIFDDVIYRQPLTGMATIVWETCARWQSFKYLILIFSGPKLCLGPLSISRCMFVIFNYY